MSLMNSNTMLRSKQSGHLPKQKPKALKFEPVLACKPLVAAVASDQFLYPINNCLLLFILNNTCMHYSLQI